MREPILSLTDSPETPSLFLSHSAIIWRKPGEGRGWKKGWKRNRWNFRASRHNARRISLTRLGKQEKNALISRPLPPFTPSFVPGQYERCAGKRISSRFPFYLTLLSPLLFSSSPAYLSLTLQLLLSFQFPSNFLTANNFSLRFSILYFSTLCVFFSSPFSFRSGCKLHFLHYRVYTRR